MRQTFYRSRLFHLCTLAPYYRAEWIITGSRLVLTALTLMVLWFTPYKPTPYVEELCAVSRVYVAVAWLLAWVVWRLPVAGNAMRYVSHGFDLLTMLILLRCTGGPTSAIFLYAIFPLYCFFALFCAAVYWHWQGIMWTGIVALTFFLGLGVYGGEVIPEPNFDLPRFSICGVALALVAALLTVLTAYRHRFQNEIAALADWHPCPSGDSPTLLRDILSHIATLFRTPRLLLVWEDLEEPGRDVAYWSEAQLHWSREACATFEPLVAAPLANTSFLCTALQTKRPTVLYQSAQGCQFWFGAPLHAALSARFAPQAVLALRLQSSSLEGWLLSFDMPALTSDAFVLGTLVAQKVTACLEHHRMAQQLQQTAAMQERLHLARDMHDGVLQTLTGLALQLSVLQRTVLREPVQQVQASLKALQQLIVTEQHTLRQQVQRWRAASTSRDAPEGTLVLRLQALGEHIGALWGLHVVLDLQDLASALSATVEEHLYYVIHEALINVARHAAATEAWVYCRCKGPLVALMVQDNGRGFPFYGEYTLETLLATQRGPRILCERVAALGGMLRLHSTPTGTTLIITVPRVTPGVEYVYSSCVG